MRIVEGKHIDLRLRGDDRCPSLLEHLPDHAPARRDVRLGREPHAGGGIRDDDEPGPKLLSLAQALRRAEEAPPQQQDEPEPQEAQNHRRLVAREITPEAKETGQHREHHPEYDNALRDRVFEEQLAHGLSIISAKSAAGTGLF